MPGDYATVEADGSITLLGRGSIVINSGGEKIFPEEVESAVRSHPDVMDAIVCGAPDERWGQTVAAIVEPRRGHDARRRSRPSRSGAGSSSPATRSHASSTSSTGSSARPRASPTTPGPPRSSGPRRGRELDRAGGRPRPATPSAATPVLKAHRNDNWLVGSGDGVYGARISRTMVTPKRIGRRSRLLPTIAPAPPSCYRTDRHRTDAASHGHSSGRASSLSVWRSWCSRRAQPSSPT